jgi:hypothetical protein
VTLHGPDCAASKALLLALGAYGKALHLVLEAAATIVETVAETYALIVARKSLDDVGGRCDCCVLLPVENDEQGVASVRC